ncbi:MAG: type II secretion system protein GspK [Verrucomicrobiales bacterium]|nr:type II secretion system protein GspK [Verrucomicrobiales bacterium]
MKSKADINVSPHIRGSALIAILWIVAILSVAVFTATQFLFIELESDSNAASLFRAEQLADRGIALAAHPDVEPGDPILVQQLSDSESFSARISSEGERLNLNTLLENATFDRIVLEELFVDWGLRFDEAADVVDNLIDWVDPDNNETNLGAEQPFYLSHERPRHPYNRPFRSLEEVELVNQFDLVRNANPNWKESFTLLSSGKLDLNEAPAELILATCECGEAAAEAFIEVREQMRDGPDYQIFESLEEAIALLSIPPDFEDRILARITVEEAVKRLVSVGRFGSIAVERVLTVQYTGETGIVQQWTSRRLE